MNISEVTNAFNPHLSSKTINFAVRPTTIWTLQSDSSIYIFKRSNPKVFSKFPFEGHDPLFAKISVDSLGEKCVVFWDRPPILFFSLATGVFDMIPDVASAFSPSSACWISIPGSAPSILIGSSVGEVMAISSDEDHESNFLYVFEQSRPIREIYAHVEGETKMVFLLIEEQVYTFISPDPLHLIFAKGHSNKVLILGEMNTNMVIDHRISLDTLEGSLRLTAIHQLGIISFKAEDRGTGAYSFNQTITEVGIDDTICFEMCPWGLLMVFSKNILFMYQTKPKTSLPIQNVKKIACDSTGLVMFTEEEIITISLKSFRQYLVRTAVKQKDYSYAFYVAQNDPIKFFVLQQQIAKMPLKKVGLTVKSLKWTINEVVSALGLKSKPLLFYLTELINSFKKSMVKQRSVVIHWVLHLHSLFYPELESEFIDFLKKYGNELRQSTTFNQLDDISFDKGKLIFSETINNAHKYVDNLMVKSDYIGVIDFITNSGDNDIKYDALTRLLKVSYEDVKKFMVNNYLKLSSHYSIPILAHIQNIAHHTISEITTGSVPLSLLAISLCISHMDEKMVNLMRQGKMNLGLLYRIANTFDCYPSLSHILISMRLPKLAVRTAMKVGIGFTNVILSSIKDMEMQKEAWIELLHIVTPEEHQTALMTALSSRLFTFEELIDVIGDDAFLYEYSDEMLDTVTELEKNKEVAYYRTKFPNIKDLDFPISEKSSCHFCDLPLIGTKFTSFPCSHFMHRKCLDEKFNNIKALHPDEAMDSLDSCPICGLVSVETFIQPFPTL